MQKRTQHFIFDTNKLIALSLLSWQTINPQKIDLIIQWDEYKTTKLPLYWKIGSSRYMLYFINISDSL